MKNKNMIKKKRNFFYENSLSIVIIVLMIISLSGQFYTGWQEKNRERHEKGKPVLSLSEYSHSGHFIQATFENWESEFLQMTLYVLLTIYLRQKGSSESKKLYEKEDVDEEPKIHPDAPWPVKKGGLWLKIYSHSLSLALAILFLLSFVLHLYGSLKDFNEEQLEKFLPLETWTSYLGQSRFWFESFQNWQSEFLSIASIVLLSVWLREKGSPESKRVDASYGENP